jgi:3-oxoacyl-[acyl-carrier protein] reductase
MHASLSARTALVTGATGGIGRAIAHHLAAAGATVALAHLEDHHNAAQLSRELADRGTRAEPISADLRNAAAVDQLCAEAADRLGPIDILVSNAGAYPRTPWADLTNDQWQNGIDTNLTSHYHLAHALAPAMSKRGWGRIITIGSITAAAGRHDLAPYIAAKAGLEGLTRALARELGPAGITANCIAPGSIQVPAEHDVVPDIEAMTARQLNRQCIQRRGQPADVAVAVAFLATEQAGFITGQTLRVDGGWILG